MNLSTRISDIIYEDLPLNSHCPHCDADFDVDCVLPVPDDLSAEDREIWDKMVLKVMITVGYTILSSPNELVEEIRAEGKRLTK